MFSFVRDRSLFMDGRGRIFWGRDQFFGKSLMGGAYIWRVPNGGPLFAKKSYVYILFFCCFDKEWAYLCQYSSICDGATFLAIKRPGGHLFLAINQQGTLFRQSRRTKITAPSHK